MRILTILTFIPALFPLAAQADSRPMVQSSARFVCAEVQTGSALELEAKIPAVAVRMSVWGDGLTQLRREGRMAINGHMPGETPGTAGLCLPGSPCKPIRARFEKTGGQLLAGSVLEGRLYWYEPSVDREISLPIAAVIAPNPRACR